MRRSPRHGTQRRAIKRTISWTMTESSGSRNQEFRTRYANKQSSASALEAMTMKPSSGNRMISRQEGPSVCILTFEALGLLIRL